MKTQNPELTQILLDVARDLVANLALDELLPLILDHLATVVSYASSSIMLLEGDLLRPVAQRSTFSRDVDPMVVQVQTLQHIREVIEQGKAVLISDTETDPRWLRRPGNTFIRCWLGVPLVVHDHVIGMLNLTHSDANFYDAAQLAVVTSFGAFAAIAIENAQLYEQAQSEIADRLTAERNLEQERALLSQRVAEQTADLRAANEEMARAARHKDEFLAAMSHELRTPLNTILGMSELLLENVYGEMNERQRRSVTNIQHGGQHLLALINDVLDVARIAAGQMQLEMNVASVDDICRSSINLVQAAAENKQITIAYQNDPDVTALHVDARRIRQVLVNLLSNAVKFTAAGATIGLSVKGAADRSTMCFTVWDTGIGIAQEDLPRLFQPFVQLDSSLARRYEGTGLGLTIVHRLVDLHDGGVELQSQPGQGSRFIVTLPWQRPATATAPPAVAKLVDPSRFVLIASDNAATAAGLQSHLEQAGIRTERAHNGYQALEIAAQRAPAVILIDLFLPDLDGLATTQRIRQSERLHDIPVIAISALAGAFAEQRCLAAGASSMLSKPIDGNQLQNTVIDLLHRV